MQLLHDIAASLNAINPELIWALLALAVFVICYLLRRFAPSVWERLVAIYPVSVDTSGAVVALRKVQQSWPSALLGAVLPVLMTGGDTKLALKGALVGLLAPVIHELAKALPFLPYRGETRAKPKDDDKTPPAGGKAVGLMGCFAVLAALLCASCSPAQWQTQGEVAAVVSDVANDRVLPLLESAYRADGLMGVERARDPNEAQLYFVEWKARWLPVWAAWEVFSEAHAAWVAAINSNGDTWATGEAVRKAFCVLKTNALTAGTRLPDFPLVGCGR